MNTHLHVSVRKDGNQDTRDSGKKRYVMAIHLASATADILTLKGGLKNPSTLKMDRPLADTFAVMGNELHL